MLVEGDGDIEGGAPSHGARLVLGTLGLSLLGFLAVALLLYEFKFHDMRNSLDGLPTRVLFVAAVACAAAPFCATLRRRVPWLYLAMPLGLIVFLYPLFSPAGLPYSHDPVYVYQFSQALLTHGTWRPLLGVTAQAGTYSYYPGGALFDAEVASLTALPLLSTYSWSFDLLRLLVLPLAIYALTARLFGSRCAPLAVLLYLTIPSTEMNLPTQQDFAVVWFVLAFTALAFLATSRAEGTLGLRIVVFVASVLVVMSHHVTTYLLIGFLLGLALLPWLLRREDPYPNARTGATFLRTLAIALLWVGAVSLPVIEAQRVILATNIAALLHPGTRVSGDLVPVGQLFPIYDLVWIGLALLVLVGLAVWALVETYPWPPFGFAAYGLLTSVLVGVLALPFFSAGANFLAFRVLEYAGVFFAPAAAWWITRHLADRRTLGGRQAFRRASVRHRPDLLRGWRGPALAAVAVFILVAGGSMVPLSTRDQFSPVPAGVQVSSPLFVNASTYRAAIWANSHLNTSRPMWGDYLVYTVFGGFGHFPIVWNSYPAFATTTFNASLLARFQVGQYIVTDALMTRPFAAPMFYGPGNEQPVGGIPAVNLAKYRLPSDFQVVYEDPTFTIYCIVQLPPVGA